VTFETMASEAGRVLNDLEIALAARFVEAMDASPGNDLVDASLLSSQRLFVRLQGEEGLASEVRRLQNQLEGLKLLGLPICGASGDELSSATSSAIFINVVLSTTRAGESRGRINVSYVPLQGGWTPLGKASLQDASSLSMLNGEMLCKSLDRELASAFVIVRPAKRGVGSTTLRVENHLPFTLARISLRAGSSAGAPIVPFPAVGIGPARSALMPIQAGTAVVEQVELNGL
jgi:hypothetical protein